MVMRVCILDSETKICVAAIMLDSEDQWIPINGQELANNHDGGIGMKLTDSGWISLDPPTPLSWDMIRETRNLLLTECDWIVLPDSPITAEKRQEWVLYRQALRDITEKFQNPEDVIWPTAPKIEVGLRLPNLNRVQFMFMVRKLNLETTIPAIIASLPETTETEINTKILANTLWVDGQSFERDHRMFTLLAPLLNITDAQLDEIWMQATNV